MKIESFEDVETKRRWKVVRLDLIEDVPGEIISANDETGDCAMQVPVHAADGSMTTQTVTHAFGPCGMRIVWRAR